MDQNINIKRKEKDIFNCLWRSPITCYIICFCVTHHHYKF